MRCHLAKTVSRIACAVLAHRRTERPLSHWQEIGSRFEFDRGYPGIPLCVYLCHQLAEDFEKFTVFSIYRYSYNRHQANVLLIHLSTTLQVDDLILPPLFSTSWSYQDPSATVPKHLRNAELSKRCNCCHCFMGFRPWLKRYLMFWVVQ